MTFSFTISKRLSKKIAKLEKKDKVLARIFKRKILEVIRHDEKTINTYKNLKKPMNEFKRIHLTDNMILLFKVYPERKYIIFADISHRKKVYHPLDTLQTLKSLFFKP